MKTIIRNFFFLLALLLVFASAFAQWSVQDHTKARLVSEYQVVTGQSPFWVMMALDIQPGWHTYWQNPGDSGTAPRFKWQLPDGWQASAIHWLPPHKIPAGPFVNYGYSNKAYHLVKITPKKGSANGIIQIELNAQWLVCEVECVPEQADLVLNLSLGAANEPSPEFDKINALVARTELANLPAHANDETDRLLLTAKTTKQGKAYFFPTQQGVIEPAQPQQAFQEANRLTLSMVKGQIPPRFPLAGVLKIDQNYFAVTADSMPSAPEQKGAFWFVSILAFALLGGLILNLMPCVFPVLSLKVLTLQASDQKKMQGLFYTAGVIISFVVIALVMLILQRLGTQVGWGFQLQSPAFVLSLILIFTLIGLNLFGWFEIPFSLSSNQRWRERHKLLYAFSTGVLACVVATPCSAPFMATAVGVALTQNALVALLIFVFLGFGLALPYLLIAFVPALARCLPRPGPWMETAKQLLAFPMLLSVIWLLWVFGQQKSADAIILLLLSLCALLFFFWVRWRVHRGWWRYVVSIIALVLIIWPLVTAWQTGYQPEQSQRAQVQAFTPDRLQQLIDKKKKVFVYATAAWCITCKINERVALNSKAIKDFFKVNHIQILKADWTNKNEMILTYLKKFNRAGVPLYVYYAPGKPPKVLPQLLTPGLIMTTIKGD